MLSGCLSHHSPFVCHYIWIVLGLVGVWEPDWYCSFGFYPLGTVLVTVLFWRDTMTKEVLIKETFNWGLCTVLEINSLSSRQGHSRTWHNTWIWRARWEFYILIHREKERGSLGLVWTFETSKPIPSNTPLAIPHLLILFIFSHSSTTCWLTKPLGANLIHTTIGTNLLLDEYIVILIR